jgi:glycosyltransferase involved in cell wall biosynthesis
MKIGINGFEAVVPRFGYNPEGLPNRVGSSQVAFQWLMELNKIDKKNDYIVYLPVKPTSDMLGERQKWRYEVLPNKPLWTVFSLSPAIRRQKFDVFFSPTHYAPLFAPCPQVISILDLSYKHFPELFKKKDLLKLNLWGGYSVRSARKIITISRSAKNDIIREYRVDPKRVIVIYPGLKFEIRNSKFETNHKSEMSNSKQILNKYGIDGSYILFVGTLQPRKNIVRLVEAFSMLKSYNLHLIIVGRRGWKYEEILRSPERFGVSGRVHFLEDVTDEDLPAFYKSAEIFVLPSLYEGFGLPVLEAMKYGCPVLTSNASSLPEAGGSAAVYFNPEDASDIAQKIEKVLSDKELANDMIKKGHEQVKKFSWEKSARQVLKVLEDVGNPKH